VLAMIEQYMILLKRLLYIYIYIYIYTRTHAHERASEPWDDLKEWFWSLTVFELLPYYLLYTFYKRSKVVYIFCFV
jgi:hypothetical protein